MRFNIAALSFALIASESIAFTTPSATRSFAGLQKARTAPLYTQQTPDEQTRADGEIQRLKSMAQKLRAEAAALEAEKAVELAEAAEKAFRKFDTNQDGQISFEELKAGLEKALKTELPDSRVQKLMEDFDKTGDGVLKLDEFVGVDRFRNKLEAFAREEKKQAVDAEKAAQKEQELAKFVEAQMSVLNDKEPTNTDKFLSVLPYLFPLMDSLQFGRFLIVENADNPFVVVLALLYSLYRSIPFSGFVAFLALNFLSSNPGLNRLIRFNMQQAIYIDIALFFPGLLAAVYALVASGAGFQVPAMVTELGSNVIFGSLLLTIAYSTVSSLLGVTPNKIPVISQAVEDRMPSFDMFDDQGKFVPREMRKKDDDKKEDKK